MDERTDIYCGLIEIAKVALEHEKDLYLGAALKLLRTLDSSQSDWTMDNDYIIQYGSAAYHSTNHHHAIIYGDYYFMEAIFKLKGNDLYLW